MGYAISSLSDISSPKCETNVSVTNTAELVTLLAPKKTIEIYNSGSSSIYYGDSTVDGDNLGIPIIPGETKIFSAVENGFSVYLVCATGESSTARLITYKGR